MRLERHCERHHCGLSSPLGLTTDNSVEEPELASTEEYVDPIAAVHSKQALPRQSIADALGLEGLCST